jgi:hypothetical protein
MYQKLSGDQEAFFLKLFSGNLYGIVAKCEHKKEPARGQFSMRSSFLYTCEHRKTSKSESNPIKI